MDSTERKEVSKRCEQTCEQSGKKKRERVNTTKK